MATKPEQSHSHNLVFDRVSKRYGSFLALDNISLEITSAQTTAIVGPSGCGKSTLLQLINALQVPDSGSICIDGLDLKHQQLQTLRRRMGYCVQNIALFPHMTVENNIVLLAKLEGWPTSKIEARVQILLELTALDVSLLSRHPHQLSGGQQQRAGLCRALMLNPDFLLLDEPFGAVDPITRIDIHEQYQRLQQQEQRTALLVTHDIQEALTLADSIVVMRAGKIIAHCDKDKLQEMQQPERTLLDLIRHGDN